jgi:hypothetical protein
MEWGLGTEVYVMRAGVINNPWCPGMAAVSLSFLPLRLTPGLSAA